MADFVAVIRRTVDGLSDNGPDMRAKVYEKARGAVRRQLENMKPTPSAEMIERQMVKLESAISEVEGDFAEALPLPDEPEIAEFQDELPPVEQAAVPEQEEPATEPQQEPEPEPPVQIVAAVPEEPVAESVEDHVTEPVAAEPDDVEQAPVAGPQEDVVEPEPVTAAPEYETVVPEEPAHAAEPEVEEPQYAEPVAYEHEVVAEPLPENVEPEAERETVAEQENISAKPVFEETPAAMPSASEWDLPEWERPEPEPQPVAVTAAAEAVWTEHVELPDVTGDVPVLANYEEAALDDAVRDVADNRQAAPSELTHSWDLDEGDPFAAHARPVSAQATSEPEISDWSWPVDKSSVADETAAKPASNWDEIDALLDRGAPVAATAAAVDASEELAPRPVSYKAEPRKSRFNVKMIGIAAGLLLVLAGGGYAYWENRSGLNAWVGETIAGISGDSAPETSAPAATPAETPTASETPAATTDTEVASADSGSTKFTQRLQTDGTEIDPGPAVAAAGEAEGKSVSAQTEAGQPQSSAAQAPATSADANAPQTPATTPSADTATQQLPPGAQKMFLYEERLGQSAPTAIEGNVVWSVKEESPGDDAKPEPAVQAQITVPERNLTALVTFKRNADSSLPASHVIEFVFSLPENFEGGSIDSVQRVSMKRNEQDRGDALIAVPAKITEDFHMIALNDFPEAVATNTELLRTRPWIDIPLTYRNGRRALLTLQKGPSGTDAFNTAMQAWASIAKPAPAQ